MYHSRLRWSKARGYREVGPAAHRPTPYFAGIETATVLLEVRGPSGLLWHERTVEITGRSV